MSKQHCRMLQVDIVAVFGNNVERNLVLSTKWKQTEQVQFGSTLSKGRNFRFCQQSQMLVRHCSWCGRGLN